VIGQNIRNFIVIGQILKACCTIEVPHFHDFLDCTTFDNSFTLILQEQGKQNKNNNCFKEVLYPKFKPKQVFKTGGHTKH